MYNKIEKYGKEVYLVKYGFYGNPHPLSAERQMDVTKKSILTSVKGYSDISHENQIIFSNREFIFIKEDDRKGISVELVYPHSAIMPDSFLDDIVNRFPSKFPDKSKFGEERGELIAHLSEWGWNPTLALEKTISTMTIYGKDATHWITLPSFMWEFWKNYKEIHNIPQHSVDTDGYTTNEVFEHYCKWAKEFQESHPEFNFETWNNQKETIDQWQSIK